MSKVAEGYRIPTEDEFVQGFEFEVKQSGSFGVLRLGDGKFSKIKDWEVWNKAEVWWMKESKFVTVKKNGYTVMYNQSMDNFFKPYDVGSFLEQGLLRVKIKQES